MGNPEPQQGATYCPLCGGDPRRKANIEPHKAHSAPPTQQPERDPLLD